MFIGQHSTAFGMTCQPLSVDIFDYGIYMFKKDVKTVLWENVEALMQAEYKKESLGQFAKKCGIGAASMTRIKNRDTGVRITTLEAIAQAFRLEPWQLLVDGMANKAAEWPFGNVTPADYNTLDATDRAAIEGYVDARISLFRDKANDKKAA